MINVFGGATLAFLMRSQIKGGIYQSSFISKAFQNTGSTHKTISITLAIIWGIASAGIIKFARLTKGTNLCCRVEAIGILANQSAHIAKISIMQPVILKFDTSRELMLIYAAY